MKTETLKAYAKINIGLDITGKRDDGYHLLKSYMQTVDLYDEITVSADMNLTGDEIKITCKNSAVPKDKTNIAWKAAELVKRKYGLKNNILIDIKKNIPMSAGLAGGSTDAAAVLRGLDRLFSLNMESKEMDALALCLGADVPFCLRRGLWLCEGIGEILTECPGFKGIYAVIVKPDFDVSTKWCYEEFDKLENPIRPDMDTLSEEVQKGNFLKACRSMGNVLEQATCRAYPQINEIKRLLLKEGAAGACMSGSGSTTFGLFNDFNKAEAASKKFKNMPHIQSCFTAEFIF